MSVTPIRREQEPSPDRSLPSNLEAERSILGAVLVHNDAWPLIASALTDADFYRDAHRRIFQAMGRLREAGSAIDFVLLREELRKAGDEDEVGGPAYIASLADGVPRATNVAHYVKVVREKARLRSTIYAANTILTTAYEAEQSVADLVETGVRTLLSLADADDDTVTPIGDALRGYVESLDAEQGATIATGLRDVDDLIGGFGRKKLTIIAARPGVGKSSLSLHVADHAAASAIPSAIISLEMDTAALAASLLAAHSGVSSDRMRRKTAGQAQWTRIGEALNLLSDRPLYLVTQARTLTQVAAWARRLREAHGVQLLFLDYLQLIGDPRARDRQQEIAHLSRGLKRIAIDEDMAVVAVSALNRESERRLDKRPHLSDLRESGSIEADADLVLLLHREELYKRTEDNVGIAEVIVAKNRSGASGCVKVVFLAETVRFADLAAV